MLHTLLYWFAFTICSVASDLTKCLPHNISEELSFKEPYGRTHQYPPTQNIQYERSLFYFDCCATGFSNINWYRNNRLINTSKDLYSWLQDNQLLTVFDMKKEDKNVTCELVGRNGTTLRHTIKVGVYKLYAKTTAPQQPYFTDLPESRCAAEGDTVSIYSKLGFPAGSIEDEERNLLFERSFAVYFENQTILQRNKRISITDDWNVSKHTVELNLTFHSITQEYLNRKYYVAQPEYLAKVNASFYINSTNLCLIPKAIKVADGASTKLQTILIPVLIVAFVLAAFIILYTSVYEFRMILRVRVLQKIKEKVIRSEKKTDVYIVCSQLDHEAVKTAIQVLELNGFHLCIPERDFVPGEVISKQISEAINSSSTVLAFLTNDIFCSPSWCEVALSLVLSLNQPIVFVAVEQIEKENFAKRRNIKAALKVCDRIDYCPEKPDAYTQLLLKRLLPTKRANNNYLNSGFVDNSV